MSLSHFVGFFLTTDGLSSGYGAMEGGGDVCFFGVCMNCFWLLWVCVREMR